MGIIPRAVFLFIILLLIPITACTPESVTTPLPAEIVNSTQIPDTAAPTEGPTSPPQKTDTIHLRIEFQTTSDWSDLTFLSPKTIRGVNLFAVEGDHFDYEITPERISLSQPSADAEKGNQVGITFELHLDPEALTKPQLMLLERGDLNSSVLNIYHIHNDEQFMVQEIIHNRIILDQLGRNPYDFVLDLSAVQDQKDK